MLVIYVTVSITHAYPVATNAHCQIRATTCLPCIWTSRPSAYAFASTAGARSPICWRHIA